MRTLEQWSFDELVDAHEVLDALDAAEQRARDDAEKEAKDRR